ncbi:hypothetical protein GOODEAATRI_031355, partial [Goodea atripinnis]
MDQLQTGPNATLEELQRFTAQMHQWDLSPFSVTPAASLLSRCVSVGAASQEEIDSAFSDPNPVFSSHLHEAEEQIRKQKQLDE